MRDLQYRRRFLIAVIATSVVLSMTVDRIVASFHADSWVVANGASGPFTANRFLSSADVKTVRDAPGVQAAAPMLVARATIGRDSLEDVNLLGYEPGGIGASAITEGRPAKRAGRSTACSRMVARNASRWLRPGTTSASWRRCSASAVPPAPARSTGPRR